MISTQRREYDREYRIRNKERDREKIREYQRRAYLRRVEKNGGLKGHRKGGVTKRPDYQIEYIRKIRNKTLEALGNKCVRCGFNDYRALQIDHINGGGSKERKERLFGGKFHSHVIQSFMKGENKYQLLCANCNWIKRFENKEVRGRLDICKSNSMGV